MGEGLKGSTSVLSNCQISTPMLARARARVCTFVCVCVSASAAHFPNETGLRAANFSAGLGEVVRGKQSPGAKATAPGGRSLV